MVAAHGTERQKGAVEAFAGHGEIEGLLRGFDWSRTPLGPLDRWPRSLVNYVRMILELPSPAIIFWGPEQTQIYNEGYATIMGPRHPRYFGAPYRECWPDTYPIVYPWMQKLFERGEVTRVDRTLIPVTRHGFVEETYFTFTFSPLRDDDGHIAGILQPVVEVTDAVLAERRAETIRALEPRPESVDPIADMMRALAANPNDIPFSLFYVWSEPERALELAACSDELRSRDQALTALARTARRAFESNTSIELDALESILGEPGIGPWPEPCRRALFHPIRRSSPDVLNGVLVFGLSPRLAFDDKYRNFFQVVSARTVAAIDAVRAFVDARKRAEALAELDRAKTAFFSNISHEFRTPLTLMLGPTEDALASPGRSLSGEALETVHRNELRLLKLVNALLDFSRIEAGRADAVFEPTDLSALTVDLASAFQSAFERAGLRFEVDCPPMPELAYVDRQMWEKIVLNLLSNALKFTLEGSVRLTLRGLARQVSLVVQDTGVGIPEHELPRVFERFYRIEGSRARTHEGTGIGLSLVHDLVRLHGGEITVRSGEGEGTTLTVMLPTGSAHLPAAKIGQRSGASRTAVKSYLVEALRWLPDPRGDHQPPARSDGSPDLSPPAARILIVDDNADMRDYMRRILGHSYTIDAAADGGEALSRARLQRPDLIVSDVMMPACDGFALLRALRGDPAIASIPVILVSARAGDDARVEGLRAGADDYLVKPFSAPELLARVEVHLKLARARAEAEAASRVKDEFLAVIGHELRNPLSPILTSLQLMRLRGMDTREQATIERQVAHLVRLVDDLLDISRITRGRIELRKERIECARVVLQGLEMAGPLLEQRRQTVDVQVPAEGLPVEGDRDRLAQVVSNLLTNAAKYSDPGTTIRVGARRADGRVRLCVQDRGIGIAPEMLTRIFDLFVQEPQSLDRSKGGLGLGLAIVRNLVDIHGGRVFAQSEGPGKGSEFIVELPLARGAQRLDDELPQPATPPGPAAQERRILVVDDNVDAAESLADLIRELGFEVATAHDGPSALAVARTFKPEICLLDIGLPVMDGYELARLLRTSHELNFELRIIAITGYGQDADRQLSVEAGFTAHLVKPISLDALVKVMLDDEAKAPP